jgi:hypothetical protein
MLLRYVALVALLTAAAAAHSLTATVPTTLNGTGGALLNIAQRVHYVVDSGEASMQGALSYFGTIAPNTTIRTAAGGAALKVSSASNNSVTAAAYFGLTYEWFEIPSYATQLTNYLDWLRVQIDAGSPVLASWHVRSTALADTWLEIDVLVVGYSTISGGNFSAIHFNDWQSTATRTVLISTNGTDGEPWAVIASGDGWDFNVTVSGLAVTGVTWDSAGATVARAHVLYTDTSPIVVNVTASSLVESSVYSLLRYNGSSVPTLFTDTVIAQANAEFNFTASAGTLVALDSFESIETTTTATYRVVVRSTPYTPIPTVIVSTSSTCPIDNTGVYALDSSAITCIAVRNCRAALCGCLEVNNDNSCWLRSTVSCNALERCTARATTCLELAASSGTEHCEALRSSYNASLSAAALSDIGLYRTSALHTSCQSFGCHVYRQFRPADCPLDYNRMCAVPVSYRALLALTAANFGALLGNTTLYELLRAALEADLAGILATGGSATVSGMLIPNSALDVDFFLPATSTADAATAVAAMQTNTTWLAQTQSVYDSYSGASDTIAVSSVTEVTFVEDSSLYALFDNCDSTCIVYISTAAVLFICVVFCIVSVCRRKFCIKDDSVRDDDVMNDDEEMHHNTPSFHRGVLNVGAAVARAIHAQQVMQRRKSVLSSMAPETPREAGIDDDFNNNAFADDEHGLFVEPRVFGNEPIEE